MIMQIFFSHFQCQCRLHRCKRASFDLFEYFEFFYFFVSFCCRWISFARESFVVFCVMIFIEMAGDPYKIVIWVFQFAGVISVDCDFHIRTKNINSKSKWSRIKQKEIESDQRVLSIRTVKDKKNREFVCETVQIISSRLRNQQNECIQRAEPRFSDGWWQLQIHARR